MPTRTTPAKRPTGARFGRPAGTPAPRANARRTAAPSRRVAIVPRRKPPKTGMAKVMETVGGASKGKGKGMGMGAGLALAAGAAGLAMKNRGRIQGMLRRPDQDQDRIAHADTPANPKVEAQPDGGPVGPDAPPPPGSSDHSAA
jgi:hypothetical protein